MVCYVETHIDDPQYFHLCMELTLRVEYWIRFCMKLIAVISPDSYYSQCFSLGHIR
jgi:hypothetical protein